MTGVLVTGATTPVGRRLVEVLLESSKDARVLAVGIEPAAQSKLPADARLTYKRVDLRRGRGVRELLYGPARDLEIETVVHAAHHRSASDVGSKVHAINVESTRSLLLQAEQHPTIRRFVFRSHVEVYGVRTDLPSVFAEDHPLNFSPSAPQWLRDRVEADLTVCARMGMCELQIAVLRTSECIAPECGSQLFDYLRSRVCMRPMGFDPMLNLLSVEDLVQALVSGTRCDAQGVFNIPGADTLPLSAVIERVHRLELPVPGPLLRPLYRLRSLTRGTQFRYDLNAGRFHFSGVPDGARAATVLGYEPCHPVDWSAISASRL
ncbi:MAG: NAD-dependent epimerase/dehydratase family protein [Nannocystales bacterium]